MLQRSSDPLSRPFDSEYERLVRSFDGSPIRVSFRDLVGNSSAAERFSHRFHPYPAKLLLNIPLFFLNCSQLAQPGQSIYDPFCGSGTVLVEALVRGLAPFGADSNPLARLITRAKTTMVSEDAVEDALDQLWAQLPRRAAILPVGPIDLQRWFSTPVSNQLNRLRVALQNLPESDERTFLEACFSATVWQVSLADPTVPVPVRIKPNKKTLSSKQRKLRRAWLDERTKAAPFEIFEDIVSRNIVRLGLLSEHAGPWTPKIGNDARTTSLPAPVDLIITSPPYGSAQKYIRSCSLSLQWLGLANEGLRPLERLSIGREHFSRPEIHDVEIVSPSSEPILHYIGKRNPLRKLIAATYLQEMRDAMIQAHANLRPEGHMVLVLGNNEVCGRPFDTQLYVREICERVGFKTLLALEDGIRSRGLIMKRHSSSSVIAKETILVFRKA